MEINQEALKCEKLQEEFKRVKKTGREKGMPLIIINDVIKIIAKGNGSICDDCENYDKCFPDKGKEKNND